MLVLTGKGIKDVNPSNFTGRMHKLKRTRQKIEGKYQEVYILLRKVEEHVFKDEITGDKTRVIEWGIALKKEGRKLVHEYNLLINNGVHIMRTGF